MADEQCAIDLQIVIEGIDDFALHFIVKVNNDITAKNDLRFINTLQLFFVAKIYLPKRNEVFQFGLDLVDVVLFNKVGVDNGFWRGAQCVLAVDATPCGSKYGFRKVVGRYFDVPAMDFTCLLYTSDAADD